MDAWRIGVSMVMTSNVSEVLSIMQRDLFGLKKQVDLTEQGFNRLKLAAFGAMAVIGGTAVLKGMWDLTKAGQDLVHQQALMRNSGMDTLQIAQATTAAYQASADVLGTTVVKNAQTLRELRGVLGSLPDAETALPALAKAGVVLSASTGQEDESAIRTLAKAIELRGGIIDPKTGHIDAQTFQGELDQALRTIVASNGLINANDLFGLMKQAGPMARMMDPQVFYDTVMSAVMEMGGQRAGTALTAAARALYGGLMFRRNAVEMEHFGLIDPSKVAIGRGGAITMAPGYLTGGDVLDKKGLFGWVQDVLRPAFEQHGITDNKGQMKEIYRMFPTETMRRFVALFLQNAEQVVKDQHIRAGAAGLSTYGNLMGTATESDGRRDRDSYGPSTVHVEADPVAKMKAFTDAWTNLTTALGVPMVDIANRIMGKLTTVFTALGQWAAKNQDTVKIIEVVTGGLAAASVAFGLFAVGSAVIGMTKLPGALKALSQAAAGFAPGGAGASGIGGLTGLLGGLSAAVAAAYAGIALHDWAVDFDKGHPWARRIDNWLLRQNPADKQSEQDAIAKRRALSHALNPTANWGDDGSGSGAPGSASNPLNVRGSLVPLPPAPNVPGSSASNPVHVQGSVAVTNGRDLANGVSAQQAKAANKPNSGPTYGDPRSDSPYAGLMGAY